MTIVFVSGCHQKSEPDPEPAYIVTSKTLSQAQIHAIDGDPIGESTLQQLTPGPHTLRVSCRLDNGMGIQFSSTVDFESGETYCFAAIQQHSNCVLIYAKSHIMPAEQLCANPNLTQK